MTENILKSEQENGYPPSKLLFTAMKHRGDLQLRGEKVNLKCEHCGKEFVVDISKARYNASRFCSKECYHGSRKKGETRNCLWCKAPFYQTAYQVNRYDKRWCCVDHKKQYLENAVAKEVAGQ